MIQQVESFRMEFKRYALADVKRLQDVEIQLIESTGIKRISDRISITVSRGSLYAAVVPGLSAWHFEFPAT